MDPENCAKHTKNNEKKCLMTDEEIMAFQKADLVEYCKLLGIDKFQDRQPIQQRFKQARDIGICYFTSDQIDNPEVEQLAKERFSLLTRWQYLEDKDESVDLKDILLVECVKHIFTNYSQGRTEVRCSGREK